MLLILVALLGILGCVRVEAANAEDIRTDSSEETPASSNDNVRRGGPSDSPDDPGNLLPTIQERRTEKSSLFSVSPFQGVHDATDRAKDGLYKSAHLQLGLAFTHVFQWLSEAPLGGDTWGTASTLDFLGTWELVNRGGPTQGQLYFHLQGRWEYGTTGPERLGTFGFGSLVGTANTFSQYAPDIFLMRNLYWQHGSKDAGWIYRVGKVTPDATLSTSAYIASPLTFLPTAGTGPFSNALTDSGLGIMGVWYISDVLKLLGVFSDANADRQNFGNITAGDFYKAAELGWKIAPKTSKGGYSKLALWHTDATEDGEAVNGHLGPEGWGFFLKFEQELTDDGRAVGIVRYGRSFDESAVYQEQVGVHFVLQDPTGLHRLKNDLLGVAFNWVQANVSGARGESDIEVFYRFPLFPQVDMSLIYQGAINPALDHDNDFASVFSLRLRTTL